MTKVETSIKKFDPFNDPPSELLVTELPETEPTHFVVLNKFPVIANHFILATKAYKKQTDLLEQDDLQLTYACLSAWEESSQVKPGQKLFAFFNSGEHSGASQPHRHLQFLPLEQMKEGAPTEDWHLLIDLIASSKNIDTSSKYISVYLSYID